MYKFRVDSHVHSILTNHAYSTIEENAKHARRKGIHAIAITDHFGPNEQSYINNIVASIVNRKVLPRKMYGVSIIKGVELDIIDHDGNLPFSNISYTFDRSKSLLEAVTSSCEIVIASVHPNDTFQKKTIVEHTNMYIKVLENPCVNIIGHSGRSGMEYDIKEVLRAAYENKKAIEINAESLNNPRTKHICKNIIEKCAEENVYITIGSDAHCACSIGNFKNINKLLKEIRFPKELILNIKKEKFMRFFNVNSK